MHTFHEIDGNLIATEDINLTNGLKDILYYPKIEGDSVETEVESLKM